MSYEGLRLPKQTAIDDSVPSLALRSGNLSSYSTPVYEPGTGAAVSGQQIPPSMISPVSANALTYLLPLPNAGSASAIANNYVANIPTPISANQADLRLDQVINSKMTVFARGTYKIRSVETTPDRIVRSSAPFRRLRSTLATLSPLTGSSNQPSSTRHAAASTEIIRPR